MRHPTHNPVLMLALVSSLAFPAVGSIFPAPALLSSAGLIQQSQPAHASDVIFVQNVGQFDPGARFQAHTAGATIWLAQDAIWLTLIEPEQTNPDPDSLDQKPSVKAGIAAPRRVVHLRLSFVGANPQPRLEPFDPQEVQVSYFKGSDPAGWRSSVPVWRGVRYLGLYPGIDLELLGQDGQLSPRLLAHPGADLGAVRLQVQGAGGLSLDGDRLLLDTPLGAFSLPMFQVVGAVRPAGLLPSLEGDQVLAPFASLFPAGSLAQASDTTSLVYATFLGGLGLDNQWAMAVDSSGFMYLGGFSLGTDFPVTPGAYDLSMAGITDAYVAKLNPSGSALVYATYLGGSGIEEGFAMAIDSGGAAYLTGWTTSADFPTTPGAFDRTMNAISTDDGDAFLTKLNSSGSSLVFSTYLGGKYIDEGDAIALDASGSAYVAGYTQGGNFPTTAGAFDTTYNLDTDGFVTKFNPQGSALLYSTYLGGGGSDVVADIALDPNGAAYVTGSTRSAAFPTTPGAFDTSFNLCMDAFVTKLHPSGSTLEYSTYLGGRGFGCGPTGNGFDAGNGIAVDSSGSAYVVGGCDEDNFPVTIGAYDPYFNGDLDAFIAKFNPSGSELLYATFLGDTGWEAAHDIALDSSGAAYVTGQTRSNHFPTTPGALDTARFADEGFAAKFSPSGSALVYSTYLGGDDYEDGRDIAVDSSRAVYLTGSTGSSNFPSTPGSFNPSFNGDRDAYAIKMWMAAPDVDAYVQAPTSHPALPGGIVNIPISYGNAGLTTAASPVLTATLHADLVYLSDTSGIAPVVSGQALVWSLPDLPFSSSGSFYLRLRLPAPALPGAHYPVQLQIASTGVEDNPADNALILDVVAVMKIFLPLVRR